LSNYGTILRIDQLIACSEELPRVTRDLAALATDNYRLCPVVVEWSTVGRRLKTEREEAQKKNATVTESGLFFSLAQ